MVDKPTVISTFAGCGGSSLGYKLAGFKELLAVEFDPNAIETFKLNFPDVPIYSKDIKELSGRECMRLANIKPGELDVLDGSPPCQGFSTNGQRKFDDPRNSLFKEYVRLLKELQPKVFVMENVKGLIQGYMKQAYLAIINSLRDCGYTAKGEVLNAMYYNVPQNRQRVIIIGVRNDLGIKPIHPKPQSKPISASEAWQGLPAEYVPPLSRCFVNVVPKLKQGQSVAQVTGTNKHQQTTRIRSDRPVPTITKIIAGVGFGALIHPTEDRVLSIGEMKRATSLPDDFKLIGKYAEQKARIGNSVPPLLMKAIAETIRDNILAKIP